LGSGADLENQAGLFVFGDSLLESGRNRDFLEGSKVVEMTIFEYQQEFDRRAEAALLALGPNPTRDERQTLRYYGMAALTRLEPEIIEDLAELAYECAYEQEGEKVDRLAEMFFRGFALARFIAICGEESYAGVVHMN
jgi:hypothetical protein